MKITTIINQILLACFVAGTTVFIPQIAQSQLPTIIDNTQPVEPDTPDGSMITAAANPLKVSCQDLKTVVQKGDREAVMVAWNSNYFGKEFTPEKRCQMVSERLQQAANNNGGTFKDLELASGTVNSQPVVCALQSGTKKCDRQNLLFTLKPENARNPEAVIQKLFNFAQDGSGMVEESATQKPKPKLNLGNWEKQAFSRAKPLSTSPKRNHDTGF